MLSHLKDQFCMLCIDVFTFLHNNGCYTLKEGAAVKCSYSAKLPLKKL